jgi:hypothetical protein
MPMRKTTIKKTRADDSLGKKSDRVIQGSRSPCPFCTNDKIIGEHAGRSYVWESRNKGTNNSI